MLSVSLVWGGFLALILSLLALDLFVLQRGNHEVSTKEAVRFTLFWIALSLVFNVAVYFIYDARLFPLGGIEKLSGKAAAIRYFTGYLIEKMLSLDNIFVMAALITAFRVPKEAQHRVLYWGILGALVMRGAMISVGTVAIARFHWLIYPLAALLVFTGFKILFLDHGDPEPNQENLAVRLVRRIFPVEREASGARFFLKTKVGWAVTPTFLALVAIETSDVLFALDSVPAVLAITIDPFIVFSSNVFAILGLRSLYFVLGTMLDKFVYLKHTLALILVFVGAKMGLSKVFHIDPLISLGLIMVALVVGASASIWFGKKRERVA